MQYRRKHSVPDATGKGTMLLVINVTSSCTSVV